MTAPHLPAHGSAAPLIPHSVKHGQTPPPGAHCLALQGDGGTDGLTITLGEWQTLRLAHRGEQVDPTELYRLEHMGLVDIDDAGHCVLTPEGRLTLFPTS